MYRQTVSVEPGEEVDEELDNVNHRHVDKVTGPFIVPIEGHIKTIFYRFDK